VLLRVDVEKRRGDESGVHQALRVFFLVTVLIVAVTQNGLGDSCASKSVT